MNKNFALRSSVTKVDGQLLESYERLTNATPEQLENLGLDPNVAHYAKLGAPQVREYLQLIAYNIANKTSHQWKISDIGTDVEIDNIYVQVPSQDSFDLEVYHENGAKLLDLNVGRSRNLLELPNSILTQDLILKLYARADIGLAVINCRPAVLMGKFYSDETTAAASR